MTRARAAAERLGARTTHAAVVATALVGLLFGWAAPGWADHVVAWGIDRPDGPREIETDGPVQFAVSVAQDGSPLAGWPMTARVADADGAVVDELSFATDDQGIGRFTVPAGGTRVIEVCDADGCVYGDAVMYPVGVAPTAPVSEEPADPTETPTRGAPGESSAPAPAPGTPADDATATDEPGRSTPHDRPAGEGGPTLAGREGDGDGGSGIAPWVAVFVILTATAGGAVAWRQRSD